MTKKPKPATRTPIIAVLTSNTELPLAGTFVAEVAGLLVLEDGAPVEVAACVLLLPLLDAAVGAADEEPSLELELDPELPPQSLDGAVPSGTIHPPCTVGSDSELDVSAAAVR